MFYLIVNALNSLCFIAALGLSEYAFAQEVKIGLASNFSEISSSSFNPYGDYFREGIQLALRDSQAQLKKKNIRITFEEFDYGISPLRVLDAARKSAASSVIGVIGYNYSSHALLAAPIHRKAGLPMLTPSATADRIGQMGAFIHTSCFNNSYMGKTLAGIARNTLKAKKAAIVVAADCAYCLDLSSAFTAEFKTLGGQVLDPISVLDSDTDFSKMTAALKSKAFDVILVPNHELSSSRIIKAISQANIHKPFLGGDGWGNVGTEFFSVIGDAEIQGFSVSHWHSDLKNEKSSLFYKQYVQEFHKAPNDSAVLAYDAMLLMVQAVMSTHEYTRAGLENSLNRIRDFQGVTGNAIFAAGSAPQKSMVLLAANKTKFKVLKTLTPQRGLQ